MMLFVSFALSIATGTLFVALCWPFRKNVWHAMPMRICLGIGTGLGISSVLFFIWLTVHGYCLGFGSFIFSETLLLFALLAVFMLRLQKRPAKEPAIPAACILTNRPLGITLITTAAIGLAGAMLSFYFRAALEPHGGWDAWAIWNNKARFFFRSPADWKAIFSPTINWINADYPLLLPCIVAKCWHYMRSAAVTAPIIISFFYTFSTIGILWSSLSFLRCKEYGILGALIVMSTPFFIIHGASQYADIPFGFYLLATLTLFALFDSLSAPDLQGSLLLAGVTAGLAAWTKNEGSLFLITIIIARSIIVATFDGIKPWLKQTRTFLMGIALPVFALIYFKLFLAPPNKDIGWHSPAEPIARLTDLSRYAITLRHFMEIFAHFGFIFIGAIPVLIVFIMLAGVTLNRATCRRAGTAFLALTFMVAGYFFVYILTGLDLAWHIGTTINRLAIQLWPTIIFFFFMLADIPTIDQPPRDTQNKKKRR